MICHVSLVNLTSKEILFLRSSNMSEATLFRVWYHEYSIYGQE